MQRSFCRQLLGRQLGVQLDDDLHDEERKPPDLNKSYRERNDDPTVLHHRAIGSGASAATNSNNTNRTLTVPASQTRPSNTG
jgi:hypothetical protein